MRGSLRLWLRRHITYRWARRIVVAVIGGTVFAIGIAMVVLPGPAIVVVPIGLGILGLEFAWARYWLRKLRATAARMMDRMRRRGRGGPPAPPPPREPGTP